jgi:chromosome segregation ATPase
MGGPGGGKGKLVLSVVIILILSALAGAGFYLLQNEKAVNISLQQELESLKAEQKLTVNKLEESRNMISGLEKKLHEAKLHIDKLTLDFEQEKAARQQLEVQADSLKQDLENQKSLRADLEKKVSKSQEDVKLFQDRLKDLDSKKAALENTIKELQAQAEKVELGKIVVASEPKPAAEQVQAKPAPGKKAAKTAPESKPAKPAAKKQEAKPAAAQGLEGKVLVVNRDYNFAVINLGNKDGVAVEDIFSVYHNNKPVGDIKVMKVHDAMSAADFVSMDIKSKIAEDDKVVRKAK